jgi:hypothetical protein
LSDDKFASAVLTSDNELDDVKFPRDAIVIKISDGVFPNEVP